MSLQQFGDELRILLENTPEEEKDKFIFDVTLVINSVTYTGAEKLNLIEKYLSEYFLDKIKKR